MSSKSTRLALLNNLTDLFGQFLPCPSDKWDTSRISWPIPDPSSCHLLCSFAIPCTSSSTVISYNLLFNYRTFLFSFKLIILYISLANININIINIQKILRSMTRYWGFYKLFMNQNIVFILFSHSGILFLRIEEF